MKQIPLTQGKFALVDDEDFEFLNQFKWHAYKSRNTYYAGRKLRLGVNKRQIIIMHRQILGLEDPSIKGDHIDHNGLNNQRCNLRMATNAENCKNQKPKNGYSSKYKGVCWHKRDNKWNATIFAEGKKKHLGYFIDEIEAAKAYDSAAKIYFKEFACLNFKD
jgi:hypothetical protein